MMPLPPWLYEALREDARLDDRPATWQLRHILFRHLIEKGRLTREDILRRTGEDVGELE